MYSLHQTLLSPSGADHVLEAAFTGPNDVNLILVKANVVSVFNLEEYDLDSGDLKQAAKLVHISDYKLHGRVSSIGTVRTNSGSGLLGMDSLLLAFADAKMSLLEYSIETNSINTVSIHYYEKEEFKKIYDLSKFPPQLVVDYQSRCAVMSFFTDRLAILPFKREENVEMNNIDDDLSRKVPYLPSLVIHFSAIDPLLQNMVDFCFLYEYNEPTLAILYEPAQTWTGRLAEKQDTKSLIVVSVDATANSFPVIFRVDNIPYNAFKIVAIPGPTGGLVILTPNGLIFVDQTCIPGLSVSVNKYFGKEREIKIHQENQMLSTVSYYDFGVVTDCSEMDLFLGDSQPLVLNPDTLLLILNDSRFLMVHLKSSDSNTGFDRLKGGVSGFKLGLLPDIHSVVPSAICRLGKGYLPPRLKNKPRSRVLGSLGSLENGGDSVQMGYFYVGSREQSGQLIQFVEDKIKIESVEIKTEQKDDDPMDFDDLDDIYGTSESVDTGASGSITQRFKFRLVDDVFAVGTIKDFEVGVPAQYSTYKFQPDSARQDLEIVTCGGSTFAGYLNVLQQNIRPRIMTSFDMPLVLDVWTIKLKQHEYIFMSKQAETLVLNSSKDLTELEKTLFFRNDRSIQVQAIGDCIVQVTTRKVFLYDSAANLLDSVDLPVKVVKSSISKNTVVLLLENGNVSLVKIEPSGLELQETDFKDLVCVDCFNFENADYCALVSKSGSLTVLNESLSTQVFKNNALVTCPEVLKQTSESFESDTVHVLDILFSAVDNNMYLFVKRSDGSVSIYSKIATSWSFTKIPTSTFIQDYPQITVDPDEDSMNTDQQPLQENPISGRYFRPFGSIGSNGYSGVFCCGKNPFIAFTRKSIHKLDSLSATMTENTLEPLESVSKSQLAVHPFKIDGQISCFSEFNNVNCKDGFIYINSKGSLRIAKLVDHFNYETEWPCAKIKFPISPESVTFHASSETYIVSGAVPVPFLLSKAKFSAAVASGIVDVSEIDVAAEQEAEKTAPYLPKVNEYKLFLVSPVTWEIVDTVDLLEYEHVLSMQVVTLNTKSTSSGKKDMLVVGTGFVRGEDLPFRGRILLYDIIEVVPDPNNPQTNHKLKFVSKTDEKNQVSAITSTTGHLVCAVGPKIFIYSFDDDETLNGIAFHDVNFYVTSLSAVKNLIVVGDVLKSVCFLAFQEEPPKFVLLGRDQHRLNIMSTDYIIDDANLGIVVADSERNLQILHYLPYHLMSANGQKLMRKGEFHADSLIGRFKRIKRLQENSGFDQKFFCLGASFEGSLCCLTPVSENTYRRLYALYSRLVNQTQHIAGLNPRGYRQIKISHHAQSSGGLTASSASIGLPGPKMILDGDLLQQFTHLPLDVQLQVSKSIGSFNHFLFSDLSLILQGLEYF